MEGDNAPERQVPVMMNEDMPAANGSLVSPWPEMEMSIDDVSNIDYEGFGPMKELYLLPSGREIPPEIRDIFLTSLQRPGEVVPPSAEPNVEYETLELLRTTVASRSNESLQEKPLSSSSDLRSTSLSASLTSVSLSTSPTTDSSDNGARYGAKRARLFTFFWSTTNLIGTVKSALKSSSAADKNARPKIMQRAAKAPAVECISCLENFPKSKMIILSCQHPYCPSCFTTLVATSMQTESMFPPKCCLIEIPLKDILAALNGPQTLLYKTKAAEYSLKPEDRWYCPNAKCGKWIPPGKLQRLRVIGAKCPSCYTKICGYCRNTSHAAGVDCPEDFGLEATIKEAERQGWRRCYKCHTLVELTLGCRHITCRCKAQFCYTCGAKWRTCSCTEEDQQRRRAAIEERRDARSAQSRREEEEIARAVAEIEAMERREAQERAREREEQERIEALQRVLEADERIQRECLERLEAEKRREEEAEAARQREEAIRISVTEQIHHLRGALLEIQRLQQSSLISHHNSAAAALNENTHHQGAVDKSELDDLQANLASNSALRHRLLQSAHEAKVAELTSQHEEEEDNIFVSMQERLHGKPNREARVQAVLDKLQQRQKGVMNQLDHEHSEKRKLLEQNVAMESKTLAAGYALRSEDRKAAFDQGIATLRTTVAVERRWFEVVAARRNRLFRELQRRLWSETGIDSDIEQTAWCDAPGQSGREAAQAKTEAEPQSSSSFAGTVLQGKQKVRSVLPRSTAQPTRQG